MDISTCFFTATYRIITRVFVSEM